MDIEELRTFTAIARSSSFGTAARELNRTQPAISRRIASLESTYGAKLLERLPTGTRLTPAGKALLPHVRAMLAAIEDGRRACAQAMGADDVSIKLAIVGTLVGHEIAQVIDDWQRAYVDGAVQIVTANSARISEMVQAGEFDIGLRYHPDLRPTLENREVGRERMILVAAAKVEVSEESIFFNDRTRWITYSPKRPTRETFDKAILKQLGRRPHRHNIVECDSLLAQLALIQSGFGVGLLPMRVVQKDLATGYLQHIKVPNLEVSIPICLVTRKHGFLSKASLALIKGITHALTTQSCVAEKS